LTIHSALSHTLTLLYTAYPEHSSTSYESDCQLIIDSRKSLEYKELACMSLVCAMTDGRIEERVREWAPVVKATVLEYLMAQGNNMKELNQSNTSRDFIKPDLSSRASHPRNSASDLQSLSHSQLSSLNNHNKT
jgi:hypothetical protein